MDRLAELEGTPIAIADDGCNCWSQEEWDDSTVSSNVSRMRIQSRIEATTRRERALAYAFSQQVRSVLRRVRLANSVVVEPNALR